MKPDTRFFEETQWLRDARWIWFVGIGSGLSTLVPLLYIGYWQLIMDEPIGDTPMSDRGIVVFFCVVVAMIVIFICVVRIIRLNVYIDKAGVHYNFFPSTLGWKLIQKEHIVDYEVRQKNNFFEHIANGYANNRLAKTCRMTLHGSQIVRFRLDNRWKIILGTQRSHDFELALKRMLNGDPIF